MDCGPGYCKRLWIIMELWTMAMMNQTFTRNSGILNQDMKGLWTNEQAIARDLGLILRNCNDCVKKRLIIMEDLTS